ncbi:DUF4129 domain-containing protein [Streptomyces sp. NRRL B-24484]|uniref:DUF4129 domain-containing protein n=1 Tax=Streptomyces sp. NRRL B-24484 TaxID=1463833 RepID=UPI000A5C4D9B|nr:DUF4129 domain-containing protein [Streptomyces sp. NRRL B-24484]
MPTRLLADGAPVTVPRGPARDAARDELLNPAYHRHDPSLVQRATAWLDDRIGELFGKVGESVAGTGTGIVLAVLLAAIVVAAVWWRLGAPRREARSGAALFAHRGPRTADQHRAEAAAHAAAGDWPQAVREQMRALVRALEERTVLDVRPGRTADEAAAEAGRTLPDHAAALTAAARTFDDVVYGERTADRAAYDGLLALDRALGAARPVLVPTGGAAV